MTEGPHAVESFVPLFDLCSNIGRWGYNDERGTLNFINSGVVKRAIATVTEGDVVALGKMPLVNASDAGGSCAVRLNVFYDVADGRDALDTVAISPHGFEVTHLDAVSHSFFEGMAYNGRRADEIVHPEGLEFGGIEAMADGIVTRGLLLDVAKAQGRDRLEMTDGVSAEDLTAAVRYCGEEVLDGDAVFVRTGIGSGGPREDGYRAGLLGSAVQWLYQHNVSLYSGDCIERLPSEDGRVPMVLHQVGHVAMGLSILDNPDVERLSAACDQHGRSHFLLVVAALGIRGATGCAVNPLAVF